MHDTLKLWTDPDTRYVRASYPTAIGAVILSGVGAATGVAVPTTATIFGAEVSISAIVGTAVVLGVAVTGELLLTQRATSKSQDGQQNVKQPIPPRRRHYGQVKAGAAFNFQEEKGGYLYEGLLISDGERDSILEHWLNDDAVTLNLSNEVTDPPTYVINDINRVRILSRPGTETQTAYSQLTSAFPSLWTSAHQAKGIFNVLCIFDSVKADKFQKIYPQGVPNYRVVFRSSRLWNPADSAQLPEDPTTWLYQSPSGPDQGENAVLCLLDYLRHDKGAGIPTSFFMPALDEWTNAAAVANDNMPLKNGGTEPRYRLAGAYEVPTPPKDMIAALTAASDSWLYMRADGAIGIKPGVWEEPTVTITDDHIIGAVLRQGRGPLRTANVIKGKYTSRDHDYQPTDADPWRDEEAITQMGEELERNLDLSWVPSHAQARRLMKIDSYRANPNWVGTIRTNLFGLNALGERRIRLRYSELGIDEPFEITALEVDMLAPAVVISLQSMSRAAWEWDAIVEEGEAPPIPDKNTDGGTIATPTGFTATVNGNVVHLTWDPAPKDNLHALVQYQPDGGTSWTTLSVAGDNTFTDTPPLAAGTYDFRMAWEHSQNTSSYATIDNVIITAAAAESVMVQDA